MQQVAPAQNRLICQEVQQVASVCVTGTGSPATAVDVLSQLLTSLCTRFRTGSCSPATLMVTGQPLLINWEIPPLISVRMKISLVSWIVSTETDPKAGGESPPGTSPWFLHQLTKVHFEQIKEASLKHLTFKTVFLLALGLGILRSEIHAWQNRNIRHQSDWSKVSLYPSSSFLQESAGQRGSRLCGPRGYTSPGPNSR